MVKSDIPADEDLAGKTVDELQANIEVSDSEVTGTLHHVTNYTGFSEDPAEQEGNYLALKVVANKEADITVQLNEEDAKTLDEDGIVVLRVETATGSTIKVKATAGSEIKEKELSISNLILESAATEDEETHAESNEETHAESTPGESEA